MPFLKCRLGRLQDGNAVLSHFNEFSENCFAEVAGDFSRHTRLLRSMKSDLEYIFQKLRYDNCFLLVLFCLFEVLTEFFCHCYLTTLFLLWGRWIVIDLKIFFMHLYQFIVVVTKFTLIKRIVYIVVIYM